MRARAALALLLGALASAALNACGGASDDASSAPTDNVLGSVAALAQCSDWEARTEEERLQTIEAIREQINLRDAPVRTPELSDEQAYEVFENGCAPAYADTVRLYILYSRAASFSSLIDP